MRGLMRGVGVRGEGVGVGKEYYTLVFAPHLHSTDHEIFSLTFHQSINFVAYVVAYLMCNKRNKIQIKVR